MLFIAAAVGIAGSFVFGLLGLVAGPAGQLERILAVICFAMTAAAVLGWCSMTGSVNLLTP